MQALFLIGITTPVISIEVKTSYSLYSTERS